MPAASAWLPNSASAPLTPPLNKMQSWLFIANGSSGFLKGLRSF
jgi:hypothetical protein